MGDVVFFAVRTCAGEFSPNPPLAQQPLGIQPSVATTHCALELREAQGQFVHLVIPALLRSAILGVNLPHDGILLKNLGPPGLQPLHLP